MTNDKRDNRPIWALNIRKRRKELGWTRLELAERSGVHLNTVQKIESGRGEGLFESRVTIAQALGCKVADLYADDSNSGSKTINELIAIIKRQESEAIAERETLEILRKEKENLEYKLRDK